MSVNLSFNNLKELAETYPGAQERVGESGQKEIVVCPFSPRYEKGLEDRSFVVISPIKE